MLLTTRNLLVSLPAASSSGKYFWLAFMVRIRHSCGTARNSFLELADQHIRALDQAVTSSSSASSSIGWPPAWRRRRRAGGRFRRGARRRRR